MGKKKSKGNRSQQQSKPKGNSSGNSKQSSNKNKKNTTQNNRSNKSNNVSNVHKRKQQRLMQRGINSFMFYVAVFVPITLAVIVINNFDFFASLLPGILSQASKTGPGIDNNHNDIVDNDNDKENDNLNFDDQLASSLHNIKQLDDLLLNDNILSNVNNNSGIHDELYTIYDYLLIEPLTKYPPSIKNKNKNKNKISKTEMIEQILPPPINAERETREETEDIDQTEGDNDNSRFFHAKPDNPSRLEVWKVNSFWNDKIGNILSNDLYSQYSNMRLRDKYYTFTMNEGNKKIRGNDNISNKLRYVNSMHDQGRFSYCKWEYSRDEIIYKSVLNWLNHTHTMEFLSNTIGIKLTGLTDMFISAFAKDQFLSTHSDSGLGDIAFILMLSQNWDSDKNGGSLNFNCNKKNGRGQMWEEISCYEIKYEFNTLVLFRVFPMTMNHFVSKVKINEPRLAVTGWFMVENSNAVRWDFVKYAGGAVYP